MNKKKLTDAVNLTDVWRWSGTIAADQVTAELEKAIERPDVIIILLTTVMQVGLTSWRWDRLGCAQLAFLLSQAKKAFMACMPLFPAVMVSSVPRQLVHCTGVKVGRHLHITDH